jgi:hypothetical protein
MTRWESYITSNSEPPECLKDRPLKDKFLDAKEYYFRNNYNHDILLFSYQKFKEVQIGSIKFISFPFVDTNVDVNDIGVFAGGVFVILIYVFVYTLQTKKNSLRVGIKFINENGYGSNLNSYYLMALNQVLTIKVFIKERNKDFKGIAIQKALAKTVSMLLVAPAVVQTLIITYDIYSFKFGYILNERAA